MFYKVFIPTAGTGSRLKNETKHINKSLVLVDNKPLISHIINKFSIKTNFVIALGYKGDLVKQYLKIAHPENKFKFVYIKNFEGKRSGLGLTLLKSKKFLQSPFIFFSCDTFVKNCFIPIPQKNWMGISNTYNPKLYRTIYVKKNKVIKIVNKKSKIGKYNYIGLAGIYNYQKFWNKIDKSLNTIKNGEVIGMKELISNKIYLHKFKWYDCGSNDSLNLLRKKIKKKNSPTILPKENEFISFVGNKVIKFSTDKKFIKKRIIRQKILKKFTPTINNFSKNFYVYEKEKGEIFSKKQNINNFKKLLIFLNKFWFNKKINPKKINGFRKACYMFYKIKTLKRLKLFYKKNNLRDTFNEINGKKIPSLKKLFYKINWKKISDGVPVNFHGDLHFENILILKNKITLLDWRQDFSGKIKYGDLYYDLAKLLHGMIVAHELVEKKKFFIIKNKTKIKIGIKKLRKNVEAIKLLNKWACQNNYNFNRVKLLCGLIYLNIAPLHHYPYSIFLFFLGKLTIYEALEDENKSNNKR